MEQLCREHASASGQRTRTYELCAKNASGAVVGMLRYTAEARPIGMRPNEAAMRTGAELTRSVEDAVQAVGRCREPTAAWGL